MFQTLNDQAVSDNSLNFIVELEKIIHERLSDNNPDSYIHSLKNKGLNRIAQKVGEEAVETIIEALAGTEERFLEEAADLFFHYLVLLNYQNYNLQDIIEVLKRRHQLDSKK